MAAPEESARATILVATDLDDLERLMPFAIDEAGQSQALLILLHVISSSGSLTADATGMPYYDPTSALEFAAKTLQTWRSLACERGILCDALVREGNPAQQIAASVRQFQVSRILLGTRSRSKVSKLFLGSVAEQVLRSVHPPVMTVGPEAHLRVGSSGGAKVVLYATSLRETSRPSATLACHIAASRQARLVLLHVLPHIDDMKRNGLPTGLDSAAMQELHRFTAMLSAEPDLAKVPVEPRVAHGNPSIEILATAAELGASLIVLGATHRSAFQNLTRDRTIYRVLAHARCPVLTLREPAVEEPNLHTEHTAIKL